MKNTVKTPRHVQYYSFSLIAFAVYMATAKYTVAAQTVPAEYTNNQPYKVELERQSKMIIEQGEQIKELKRVVEELAASKNIKNAEKSKAAKKESQDITKQNASQKPVSQAPAVPKPVGQAPPKSSSSIDVNAVPKLSDNVSGVLTGAGTLVLETSLGYSYTDNNRVFLDAFSFIPALVVGIIDLREIKRHSFIGGVSARYGITDRWEFDIKVPYIGRNDSQRSRPVSVGVSEDEIFNASGEGIGDVELSTRFQLNSAGDGGAIYVFNLVATIPTGKSPFEVEFVQSTPGAVFPTELPTGSGYVSVQPSLTAIYPTDPGVFFGNISYGYNMDTDEEVGKVDPGDSVGISFGLGLSLNERTSMSLSYSHKHVLKSKFDEMKITGSELDIGQLIIGYSFRYSAQTNINFSVAIGVTDDSQDTRLNLRIPVSF
ncbi:MAG: hypothetical protein ACJA13_001600 [Paraglaciecola sp.]|jgi:hypothetical protein